MRKLMILISLVVFAITLLAKSPHGENFKIDCVTCHTTDNWTKVKIDSFNHSKTKFPLLGQHKTVFCRKCHNDLQFANANRDCISCHKDVHEQTVGRDCERCHTQSTWLIKNVTQVHLQIGFPLLGRHAQIDCYQCHKSPSLLRFDPIKTVCYDCHVNNYLATTNPSHVASNYPKDCSSCHNQSSWLTAIFNHNATGFPLTGTHNAVICALCHKNGYTGGTPTTCVACHLDKFNATTNPNHIVAKFSTDCQTCHNTTAWIPSTFDHNKNTTFPLTGAHIGRACNLCHITNYNPIPTTCVSCHLTTYNTTTNPNHAGANFPTTCETCHTTTNWTTSTFNHTSYFPITGNHNVSCATCHTNSANYAVFTCITSSCHGNAHNRNQGSAGCYSCHRNGRSGG
jgi:hypothetical protein